MFNDREESDTFVQTWANSNELIQSFEMRMGLSLLKSNQQQRLMRFTVLLQAKEREDQAKQDAIKRIEKAQARQRKREEKSKERISYRERGDEVTPDKENGASPDISSPRELLGVSAEENNSFGEAENSSVKEDDETSSPSFRSSQDITSYKAKHGLDVPRVKQSSCEKVTKLLLSIFSRRAGTQSPKVAPSTIVHRDTSNIEISETRNRVYSCDDDVHSMRSEDGFTNRLSMASLLLYRQEKWGDEDTRSYEVHMENENENELVSCSTGEKDDDEGQ